MLHQYLETGREASICPERDFFFSYFCNAGVGYSPWGAVVVGTPVGSWNGVFDGVKISDVPNPAGLITNGDQALRDWTTLPVWGDHLDHWAGTYNYAFDEQYHSPVHNQELVYLLADGHTESFNMIQLWDYLDAIGEFRYHIWTEKGIRFPVDPGAPPVNN